ncbi:hypothetical protein E2C01_100267 [Portunus trituberculatus]|uniref:Uncharacterized protein n=1 Tax=Portunus trituberculatus TaxID=210409 RepID=A0A5B7K7K9_PORTR|nr:hypothetical protein [Portunus trituberculatus]
MVPREAARLSGIPSFVPRRSHSSPDLSHSDFDADQTAQRHTLDAYLTSPRFEPKQCVSSGSEEVRQAAEQGRRSERVALSLLSPY